MTEALLAALTKGTPRFSEYLTVMCCEAQLTMNLDKRPTTPNPRRRYVKRPEMFNATLPKAACICKVDQTSVGHWSHGHDASSTIRDGDIIARADCLVQ